MRLLKTHHFDQIQTYELGWSFIGSPLMTVYCYVLGDVMMDTAQSHMQKEALEIASRHSIRRVCLTHHHEDHSGNAGAIHQKLNADIFGHEITGEKMAAPSNILPYQKYMWGKASPVPVKPLPPALDTPLGEMTPVHTPGHARDHLSYLIKEKGILFSGDLYLGTHIKYFRSDEDMGAQIRSLQKILSLDFDMLLCSHSPKARQGREHIKQKLDFLENLYGNIIRLWEKGMTEKQIFTSLHLRENYFAKLICCGNVSMFNGVRSAVRHFQRERSRP